MFLFFFLLVVGVGGLGVRVGGLAFRVRVVT